MSVVPVGRVVTAFATVVTVGVTVAIGVVIAEEEVVDVSWAATGTTATVSVA